MAARVGYRPEIDGLRAVAVISVLLFHLDPRWLPGGFTGVDIFLVISGFLITRQIAEARRLGRFSLRDFYLRRIRRIAPAYFTVTLATLAAACVLMLPPDLAHTGRAAAWAALSVPNVFFWLYLDTGYFAQATNQEVFLHLWSLGVEEQFYLLWPLALILLLRWRAGLLLTAIGIGCLASFALAEWVAGVDPSFAYYMLPTRAGELGLGALLALAPQPDGKRQGPMHYEVPALAGITLIFSGFFLLDGRSTFPGFNALLPCLGATLIILADGHRRCAVLAPLRSRLAVAIGILSYSIYLWHWPVLALARYSGLAIGIKAALALTLIILILATAAYWLVERPARRVRWRPRNQFLVLFALPASLVLAISAGLVANEGRLPAALGGNASLTAERLLLADTAPAYEFPDNCQLSEFDSRVLERPGCVHGASGSDTRPPDLLWGDSHAAHYIGIIGSLADSRGQTVRNASFSTCPPVWAEGRRYGQGIYRDGCTQFRQLIQSRARQYGTLYLGAQWSVHLQSAGFAADFEDTLDKLVGLGHEVVLLAEVPSFPGFDRNCEIRNLRSRLLDCRTQAEQRVERHEASLAWLQDLARERPGVSVFDISPVLCPQGRCSPYLDGRPVYFDQTHLSMQGSWRIGSRVVAGFILD